MLFLFLTSAERVDAIELRMSFTPAGLGTRRCRGKATNGSFPSWRHQAANQTSALSPSQSRILIKRKAGLLSQINAECLFCCEFICNFCWFRFCVMDLSLSLSLPPSPPPALVRAVLRSAVLVLGSRKAPGCFTQASPACCPPTCCPTLVTSFFFFSFSLPPPLPLFPLSIIFIKPGQGSLMSLRTGRLSCKKTDLQKVRFIILN